MAAEKHQQQPEETNQKAIALVKMIWTTIETDSSLVSPTLTALEFTGGKKRRLKFKLILGQSLFSKSKNWWSKIFEQMRFFLSQSLNNSLLNTAFTGIVTALIIAIISTSILLLPQQSLATEIIEQQATPKLLQSEQVNPSDNTTPLTQAEAETSPEEEIIDTSSDIDKIIKIETPSELVAPDLPESVKVETVFTQPELTPEQSFIAALQQQLTDLVDRYADELILSIEANLSRNLLLIKVSDDWYQLDRVRQNKWVNDMFSRSQEFDFKKLQIKDINNTLIARSPVVGNEMVIFKREKENG
jgi:hypothetical protein